MFFFFFLKLYICFILLMMTVSLSLSLSIALSRRLAFGYGEQYDSLYFLFLLDGQTFLLSLLGPFTGVLLSFHDDLRGHPSPRPSH